ncbi:RNA polymerase sigma factor [Mesorhizobium shangrilense]|uniref:RNA polymerase sigma factor n=1 Tax=Mesorhizobium shangrilense TaxID=460060 RepID=A0ABV2D6F3_9HYPH
MPLTARETDEELLARIARNDPAATADMVARKLPRLLGLAARMLGDRGEAEDVAQEAFLRIWQQAARWQPGTARFDTWLYRVALNLCSDRLRRRREIYVAEVPEQADTGPAPDQGLFDSERQRTVEAALAALPDRQREAIVLHYYQELSNIEAASVMEISVDALESLLARARRNLGAYLKGDDDEH